MSSLYQGIRNVLRKGESDLREFCTNLVKKNSCLIYNLLIYVTFAQLPLLVQSNMKAFSFAISLFPYKNFCVR